MHFLVSKYWINIIGRGKQQCILIKSVIKTRYQKMQMEKYTLIVSVCLYVCIYFLQIPLILLLSIDDGCDTIQRTNRGSFCLSISSDILRTSVRCVHVLERNGMYGII